MSGESGIFELEETPYADGVVIMFQQYGVRITSACVPKLSSGPCNWLIYWPQRMQKLGCRQRGDDNRTLFQHPRKEFRVWQRLKQTVSLVDNIMGQQPSQ